MDKIKAIEKYGQLYIDKFLHQQIADKDKICDDWYEALKFLFAKVFYRGRRDAFRETYKKVLELEIAINAGGQKPDSKKEGTT